jgi:hypothetical protein
VLVVVHVTSKSISRSSHTDHGVCIGVNCNHVTVSRRSYLASRGRVAYTYLRVPCSMLQYSVACESARPRRSSGARTEVRVPYGYGCGAQPQARTRTILETSTFHKHRASTVFISHVSTRCVLSSVSCTATEYSRFLTRVRETTGSGTVPMCNVHGAHIRVHTRTCCSLVLDSRTHTKHVPLAVCTPPLSRLTCLQLDTPSSLTTDELASAWGWLGRHFRRDRVGCHPLSSLPSPALSSRDGNL